MPELSKRQKQILSRVQPERWREEQQRFRDLRAWLVGNMRRTGFKDPDIARLLGVTQQYFHRTYVRKGNSK